MTAELGTPQAVSYPPSKIYTLDPSFTPLIPANAGTQIVRLLGSIT